MKIVTVLNTKEETMFTSTLEIFDKNDIPWEHAGLQGKIRERHQNLIDIGGDSVHNINNAVEKVTTAFDDHIVKLFKSIDADFRHSVDHKFLFQPIC